MTTQNEQNQKGLEFNLDQNLGAEQIYMLTAKELCRESFEDFVKEMWEEIIPERCIWNWHMSVMCQEMQAIAEDVFNGIPNTYTLVINVPPGSSKSSICSVMFPAWCWLRLKSCRSLCCSYGASLSLDLSIRCRELIRSRKFQLWYGDEIAMSRNRDKKEAFGNTSGGMRFATSTFGMATGVHSHFIIMDDPMDPTEACNDNSAKNINKWLDSTLSTRKVDKELTAIIIIMQRLSEMDTTAHFLEKGIPIRHICLPAEKSENIKPSYLAKYYVNELLDPVRMSKEILKRMRLDMGAYNFAGQMLQMPYPLGDGMFRPGAIELVKACPEPISKIVRYWDKAASSGKGCYTAGVKIARLQSGKFIVMDVKRGQWDTDARERIIRQTAMMDGVKTTVVFEQEPGSAGVDSAKASIRNLAGFKALADKPSGDKVLRADPFSTQINSGNVYCQLGEWTKDFLHELEAFPNGKYKDQVDAASGAFNYLARAPRAGVW